MPEPKGPELLAKHLKDSETSQTDFATAAGLLDSMISHYCNGTRRPGLAAALAIEKASGGKVPASSWVQTARGKKGSKAA